MAEPSEYQSYADFDEANCEYFIQFKKNKR